MDPRSGRKWTQEHYCPVHFTTCAGRLAAVAVLDTVHVESIRRAGNQSIQMVLMRPLGPLGFEGAQQSQTLRPTLDGTRSKALRPFGSQ